MKKYLLIIFLFPSLLFGQNKTTSGEHSRTIDSLKLALKNAGALNKMGLLRFLNQLLNGAKESKQLIKNLVVTLILISALSGISQNKRVDSLTLALKNVKHDTTRCGKFYTLSETAGDDDWPFLNREVIKIAERNLKKNLDSLTKMTFSTYLGYALCNEAFYISQIESPRKAISIYNRALIIFNSYNLKSDMASVIKNTGEMYNMLRIRDTALILFKRSLNIFEKLNDEKGKAACYNNIGYINNVIGNIDLAEEFYLKSLKISEKINDISQIALTLSNLVNINEDRGNLPKAYEYSNRSYILYKSIGDKHKIAGALYALAQLKTRMGSFKEANLLLNQALIISKEVKDMNEVGSVYHSLAASNLSEGKIAATLEYANKALRIFDSIGNTEWQSHCLELLASVYINQGDKQKALEYFEKAKKVFEKNSDTKHIVTSMINIASINDDLGKKRESEELYKKALEMARKIKYTSGVIHILNYFGVTLQKEGDLDKALAYFYECLKLSEETKDNDQLVICYYNIAFIKLAKKELKEAEIYGRRSLELSNQLNQPSDIKNASNILYQIYKIKNNYKASLEMHELYLKMKDSINNELTLKASLKSQFKYDFEKKEAEVKANAKIEQEKISIKAAEEKKQQNIIIYSVTLGLLLVAIFSIFIFRSLQKNKKANKIISAQKVEVEKQHKITEQQKHIIEEKHKEITDSINYAERIQRSFIATKEILNENLNDYFVLFKPKDVVSGDFYWASKLNNGNFAFVTADSTGHGVPGAIMSLLNITSLEKAIETFTEPYEILNSTRKTIIERLKKDGSEHGGKDGMDASLTVYDFKNKKLIVAAANNPVWIVRNCHPVPIAIGRIERSQSRDASLSLSMTEKEVIDIKPDKMPIGKHDRDTISFTQQEIELQKGDVIYTLTDGFPDQFGGEKGKKFMSKNLRELLAANSHLPMPEQKQLLENTFADWVGNLEQVDDVCVIGIRF